MRILLPESRKPGLTAVTETPRRCTRPPQRGPSQDPAQAVLSLHGAIGNQAVQRLLHSGGVQATAVVNQPDDPYEREADRVAAQVLQMPEPAVEGTAVQGRGRSPHIQRKCGPCREEEEPIQRKERPAAASETAPAAGSHAFALPGAGHALPGSVRAFFEPRFGLDFGQVRVHTDSEAAESARAVNALAYTVGGDIVFGAGQYAPHTPRGRHLLAHELTHVTQQTDRSQARETHGPVLGIQRQEGDAESTEELPPTGSCECDCESYCGYIAKQYAQAHFTYPSWFGEKPRPIGLNLIGTTCFYQREYPPCSWVCMANFDRNPLAMRNPYHQEDPYPVIVQLMGSQRFNVGTLDGRFPLCSYDFECRAEGGLKLSEVGCIRLPPPISTRRPSY